MPKTLPALVLVATALATHADSQEPAAWGAELTFHTFSIAAIDPETGEAGVAVSTRNPCVGNGVPWVRAGVGAVATQASTRTDYGDEILDMMAEGLNAEEALGRAIASDEQAANRQIGVIGLKGGTAQHTGTETRPWSGHTGGTNVRGAREPSRRPDRDRCGHDLVRIDRGERTTPRRPPHRRTRSRTGRWR